jgi:hypothetical protein
MSQSAISCNTCEHYTVEADDPPCRDCRSYAKWRSATGNFGAAEPEQSRSLDDATPEEWNLASRTVLAQETAQPRRVNLEPKVTVPEQRRVDVTKLAQDPLKAQVGGDHYKNRAIQPVVYSHANKLNGLEASIVKRITRWRDKPAETRFQDLEKIKHEVDLLIALEKQYG